MSPSVVAEFIFTQKDSAANAAPSLQVLAASFVLLAVITILTGVLQSIDKQVFPVINLFIGLLAKVVLTWVLVGTKTVNVVGAPLGTMAAYLIAAALDLFCVLRFTGVKLSLRQMVVKPFISSAVMGVCVFGAYKGLFLLAGSNTVATLAAIIIGVVVYGLMIIKTRTIQRDEMMDLSIGRKLVTVCDRLRLW